MSNRQKSIRIILIATALLVISGITFASTTNGSGLFGSIISWVSDTEKVSAESNVQQSENSNFAQPNLVIGTCDTAGPIEVESTLPSGPTAYATLAAAFTDINNGVHQGAINVEVCGNTTETVSAILNSGAVAPASYTSVTVRPVGGSRIITGSIVGAIIKLNGADNVTIDGRQGGAGTARDLTVTNSNTAGSTAAIWLASVAAGNGASNNVIRNLELAAGATQNTLAVSTFGIIMCGTTISATANGVDNDNNSFIANRIIRVRYGIVTRGTTSDLNINPTVTDNIIGPTSFGADNIGKVGIFMQADTGALVSRNTVQFVGGDFANTSAGADRIGIGIGQESWSMAPSTLTSNTYTVTKNIIHDVIEERTFSSVGLLLGTTGGGSPTNNIVANNFIYNVKSNGTTGDQTVGLGISGGHTDKVVFNSIYMSGDVDPTPAATATSNFGSGIRIANINSSSHANLTLSNNSIYMDLSSSSTAATRYYAVSGPSIAYAFGTGGENYNNYYINPANTQLQTGGLGTTSGNTLTTQFATLANWQAAYTVPQDANSKQADPLYVSATDLHIQSASPNESMGVAVAGVTDDFDGDVRGGTPDIGADEITLAGSGTLQFSAATFTDTEGNNATITVTRSGGVTGAVTVDYATSDGTANGSGVCASADYVATTGTLSWANGDSASKTFTVQLCNDVAAEPTETVNLAITNPTGGATLGTPNTAVLNITDNPPGTVQFSSVTYSGTEGTTATITATRTGGTSGAVTVDYATSDGTATAGTCPTGDYVASTGTLSWGNNDGASKTFTVQLCGDAVVDPSETVNLTLSNATGGATIGANNPATLTINDVASQYCNGDGAITLGDTGTAPFPSNVYPSVINVTGATGNITSMRVTLSNFTHTFADDADILLVGPGGQKFILMSDAGGPTGLDAPATLTFVDGGTVLPDSGVIATGSYKPTNYETTADVFATGAPAGPYSDPGPGGTPAGTATMNATFGGVSPNGTWSLYVSDDAGGDVGTIAGWCLEFQTSVAPQNGTVQFSSTTYTGAEGTTATITATRTLGADGIVTVDYATSDGTATAGTCGSADYVASSGTLTWADQDSASKTFTVPICSDAVVDAAETVNLTLSNATGGATIGTNNPATLTITDVPPPSVQFSAATYSNGESQVATVTVTRTGDTSGTSTVDYATSDGTATGGGSCAGVTDYVASTGTLNYAATETSKTFTVQLCADNRLDAGETVNLALSNPSSGTSIGTQGTAVLTITDTAAAFTSMTTMNVPGTGTGSSTEPGSPADPYPTTINVTGAPTTINGLRVTLFDTSHTFPDDMDILLVGPGGQTFVLMAAAGGGTDVVNADLTFEDGATLLPDTTVITSGSYEPANYKTPITNFPTGAPVGPYNEPGSTLAPLGGVTFANVFGGTNPNGAWQLFIRDMASGDTGTIGGWGLQFIAPTAANASITGKVSSIEGNGIRNAAVTISGGNLPSPITVKTGAFGIFTFDDLAIGQTYIVTIASKRYTFNPPTRVVTLQGNIADLNFVSETP